MVNKHPAHSELDESSIASTHSEHSLKIILDEECVPGYRGRKIQTDNKLYQVTKSEPETREFNNEPGIIFFRFG